MQPTLSHNHTPTISAADVCDQHRDRIRCLALRMTRNADDAEDVTQDVLLRVCQKLHLFRGDSDIRTWLHRLTYNAALEHRQRRAKANAHEQAHYRKRGPLHPCTDDIAEHRETAARIHTAIARLPAHYRAVITLADVEDQPNATIAAALGLTISQVKNTLHRARQIVRRTIADKKEKSPNRFRLSTI